MHLGDTFCWTEVGAEVFSFQQCTDTMVPSPAPADGVEHIIQQYLSSNYYIPTNVA
jgi:hypothetical protein